MRSQSWGQAFGDRTVAHVDMDAFFAQVEVLDHPEYRGKPLVVGGRKDSKRGVVSTCSYEARKFGIHSAMPIREAVRRCPNAIFIPVRMDRYEDVSRQIGDVLMTFSPTVEPLSIDEAFLDMTGCEHFYNDAREFGVRLKQEIFEKTGLTSSVGIAGNKFLAKLASEQEKPDGLTIVPEQMVDAFLEPLPINALWGVGPKAAEKLRQAGIYRVADVKKRPVDALRQLLGERTGEHVYALAFGRDERPVLPDTEAQSIGRETTFETDVPAGPDLYGHLARLVAEVGRRLRKEGLRASTLTVKIRYPDFKTHTKSKTLPVPFQDDDTLYRHARELLDAILPKRRSLRLIGVYVSRFGDSTQTSLFPEPVDPLTEVVDGLNDRLGGIVIRKGREL